MGKSKERLQQATKRLEDAAAEQKANDYTVTPHAPTCPECDESAAAMVSAHNRPLVGHLDEPGYEMHVVDDCAYYHAEDD